MSYLNRFFAVIFVVIIAHGHLQAGVITSTLNVTVVGGEFDGTTGTGSFTYNDMLSGLTNMGFESIGPVGSNQSQFEDPDFAVTLEIFGRSFDETSDASYFDLPVLFLLNGTPDFLNYELVQGVNQVDFGALNIESLLLISEFTERDGEYFVNARVESGAVPEPGSLAIFCFFGVAVFSAGRRRLNQTHRWEQAMRGS